MQNDSATQRDIHVEAEEHSHKQQSKQPGQGAAGVQPSRGHDGVIPERLTDCNVPAQRNQRDIYTKRYVVGFNLEVLLMKKNILKSFQNPVVSHFFGKNFFLQFYKQKEDKNRRRTDEKNTMLTYS